jgi:hypothetical protein
MKRSELDALKAWFEGYSASFDPEDAEARKGIALKREHTVRVCENMLRIAGGEPLGAEDVVLAEAVALLHDVGRFRQLADYGTFDDGKSINHGELGAKVLDEAGVLGPLVPAERSLVLTAVKYHNAFSVPDLGDPRAELFIRLIKDADKLDIWRIFLDYFRTPPSERPKAVALGLPDAPGCSAEVLAAVREGRVVALSSVRSLDDLKLMLLSWMSDLNFRGSYLLLLEGGFMEGLAGELPSSREVELALAPLRELVGRKARG